MRTNKKDTEYNDGLDSKEIQKVFQNIRKIRMMKGYSQQNMSDELGITQKHYSDIENGKINISIVLLFRISKILSVSPSYLLGQPQENIINHIIHNQTGEDFCFYYATEIQQVKELYEKLLKEKDLVIQLLMNKKEK
ncbi:MAG: hypothetical protein Fur0023_16360 [Bacteroidia bacterium]